MRSSIVALAVLSTSVPLCAQRELVDPFRALHEFLGLTSAQVASIDTNNVRYQRAANEKLARRFTLMAEIARETARTPLDPVAIGLRYAEAETICRDLRAAKVQLRADNFAVLNEAQASRLRVLEEAAKLLPIASLAESRNLADFGGLSGGFQSFASLLIGGLPTISDPLDPEAACNVSVSTRSFLGFAAARNTSDTAAKQ